MPFIAFFEVKLTSVFTKKIYKFYIKYVLSLVTVLTLIVINFR